MKYKIEIKLEDVDARREAVASTHVFDSDVTPILHCDALILDLLVLLNKQLRRYTPEKQIPVTAPSLHTAITRQSPSHPAPNGATRPGQATIPAFDDLRWFSYEKMKDGKFTGRQAERDESGWAYTVNPANRRLVQYVQQEKHLVLMDGHHFDVKIVLDGSILSRSHLKE